VQPTGGQGQQQLLMPSSQFTLVPATQTDPIQLSTKPVCRSVRCSFVLHYLEHAVSGTTSLQLLWDTIFCLHLRFKSKLILNLINAKSEVMLKFGFKLSLKPNASSKT